LLKVLKDKLSLINCICNAYPSHDWKMWKFSLLPREWWKNEQNQTQFLRWLRDNVPTYNNLENWYRITHSEIRKHGGAGLLFVGKPLQEIIMDVFKHDHKWDRWKFSYLPISWLQDPALQRQYLDWVFTEAGLKSLEDWYRFKVSSMRRFKGGDY